MKNRELAAKLMENPDAEALVFVRTSEDDIDRYFHYEPVTSVYTKDARDLDFPGKLKGPVTLITS